MYVGIHTASIPATLAAAQRRIILHTALYDGIAHNQEIIQSLSTALHQPGFEKLSIISVPFISRKRWLDEFLHMLRPNLSVVELEHLFNASRDFIVRLAAHHEGQVEVYETQAMPCVPCIFVDDRILFGHYAHGSVPLESGYWFSLNADTEELFTWAEAGAPPQDATPRQRASFRFVADCHHAMKHSKRMLL